MEETVIKTTKRDPFGQNGLSLLDRFGVFLSKRAINKHLPKNTELEILELGCGYKAKLLTVLQKQHKKVVGVDYSICTELKKDPRFSFIESSVEVAVQKMEAESFDLVLLISVLEHLAEPLEALRQCNRLLRPKGVLLLNVPTWRGKFFLEFSAFKLGTSPRLEMDDHKMYYDKRDLWPLLVQAGFIPSRISLKYHKFGLNLFAVASKELSVPPEAVSR